MDLVAVIIVSLIVTILAFLGEGALQIVLGLFFVLFFPGYALTTAIFPKNDDLDHTQRIALSFGLSIAIVPLLGLVVNYTPWGINLFTVLLSVFAFIAITAMVALLRRRRLASEVRFQVKFQNLANWSLKGWKSRNKLDKAIHVILVLAILSMIGALVYMVQTPQIKGKYTEFYILGPEGKAENYPGELRLGETAEVTLVIVNNEHEGIEYKVEATIDNEMFAEFESIRLAHGGRWEQKINVMATHLGENQKVEFKLYKGDDREVYQSLYFWINIFK
jgi:uncharacterized membrane protein